MTKIELIDHIAARSGSLQGRRGPRLERDCGRYRSVLESTAKATTLIGFGTFVIRERGARMGRNPQTARNWPSPLQDRRFKPAKGLKDALN